MNEEINENEVDDRSSYDAVCAGDDGTDGDTSSPGYSGDGRQAERWCMLLGR
jgi:hypothetical protein